jgi:fatty acid desaturase
MKTGTIKQPITLIMWSLAVIADYTIVVVAFYIAYLWGWPAYPATILLLGIAQHRLGILGHEGVHGLIHRNKKLNYWLAQLLCFWPLLFDFTSYQKFHQKHHSHTNDDHHDPEKQLKGDKYHLPKTRMQVYGGFILDLFGYSIAEFFEMIAYFSKRSNPLWAMSSFVLTCSISIYIGHPEFFILLMVSKPTAFWAVFRLRIYSEHIPGVQRLHVALWQRLLFAPHNIWIHWEHHKHPQVPFWQLPSLRAEYKDVPITEFSSLIVKNKAAHSSKPDNGMTPTFGYPN